MLQISADLVSINQKLRDYEAAWDAHVDAWLVVKVGSPKWVHRWRLQAEHAMHASGKPGMSDEQVAPPAPALLFASQRKLCPPAPNGMIPMMPSRCSNYSCRSIADVDNEVCMSQGLLLGCCLPNWVEICEVCVTGG